MHGILHCTACGVHGFGDGCKWAEKLSSPYHLREVVPGMNSERYDAMKSLEGEKGCCRVGIDWNLGTMAAVSLGACARANPPQTLSTKMKQMPLPTLRSAEARS